MYQVYNDEFKHHGVPGMKWGRRKISQIKENVKATNQMNKDMLRHPIHSTAAQMELLKNNPKKALNMDTNTIKKLNEDVKKRVEESKTPQAIAKKKANLEKTHGILKKMGTQAIALHQQYETQKLANEIFR
jgi:hypothetical protein